MESLYDIVKISKINKKELFKKANPINSWLISTIYICFNMNLFNRFESNT